MKHYLARITFAAVFSLALGVACSGAEQTDRQMQSPQQQAAELNSLFAEYFIADLQLNPLRATFLGDHRFNDELENHLSEEHRQRQLMLEEEYLAALHTI